MNNEHDELAGTSKAAPYDKHGGLSVGEHDDLEAGNEVGQDNPAQAVSAIISNAVQQEDEVAHTYDKNYKQMGASTFAGLLRGFVAACDHLWTPPVSSYGCIDSLFHILCV